MKKNNLAFFKNQKSEVDTYIQTLLKKYSKMYAQHKHASQLFSYLENFLCSGKSIRSSLMLECIAVFLHKTDQKIIVNDFLPLAAAIEIIHGALLIQDDLMDQDKKRRNMSALYVDLESAAQKSNYSNTERYSTSALICATDICFFIGFDQLSQLKTPHLTSIIHFLSKEYIHVGFSQWEDVSFGHMPFTQKVLLKDIEKIYTYKTARYTFVMPILIAAKITQVSEEDQLYLESAAQHMGMVFQITDDVLNIFGNCNETGKPNGSDIIENKKTFHRHFLFNALQKEKNKSYKHIEKYFGSPTLNSSQLTEITECLEEVGVTAQIKAKIATHKNEFIKAINKTSLNETAKQFLLTLFEHIENRTK